MPVYVVTYDLRKQGQDYESLLAELRRLGGHRALASFWLLNVDNTAQEVKDHLFNGYMDKNDLIWVSELTKKNTYMAMAGTNEWLKNNPPER